MRRQDEIRLLFPSQDPDSQKLLVSELDAYARAFDADEVFELLRASLGHPVPRVRHQAHVTTSWFLPDFISRRMRALAENPGLWTNYQHKPLVVDPKLVAAEMQARAQLRERARQSLMPLAEALVARLESVPENVRPIALLAVSYLGSSKLLERLAEVASNAPDDAAALWAWAYAGGGQQDPARLVAHLDRHGPGNPDALLAAAVLPGPALLDLSARLEGRLDGAGIANVAQALGHVPGDETFTVMGRLCRGANGWGQVHVLRALSASGRAEALPVIRRLHAESRFDFVRQQAIRAAGSLLTTASLEFCLEQARDSAGPVAAQALESLARLRCPRDELAAAAKPHLTSQNLRARVNALLCTVEPSATSLPRMFLELLRHADAMPRLEAAFCMGYWLHPACIDALAVQAASDASAAVRQQAVKSLSKHAATVSHPHLLKLAVTGEPGGAVSAMRVIARDTTPGAGTLKELLEALGGITDPARRAILVNGAALLAHGQASKPLEELLRAELASDNPVRQEAALAGWKLLGGPREAKDRQLVLRMASGDPAMRRSASVAAYLSGELSVLDLLRPQLESSEAGVLASACEALLELALVAGEVVGPAHALLASALEREARGTGVTSTYFRLRDRTAPFAPGLEEGEFAPELPAELRTSEPASRAVELPTDAPGASDAITGRDQILTALDARYRSPRISSAVNARGGIADAIEKDTYLVAGAAAGSLAGEPLWRRAMVTARRAAALVRMYPAIGVLVIGSVVMTLMVAGRMAAAPQPMVARALALFTVVHVDGRMIGADGQPVPAGEQLRVGDSLALDPATTVRLVSPAGDDLRLTGPGKLAVALADGEARPVVRFDGPRLAFTARGGGALQLRGERRSVICEAGGFTAERKGSRVKVAATQAGVWLETSEAMRESLEPGQGRDLE